MYICYINDLPEDIASLIFLYAGDAKVFRSVEYEINREALQRDLDQLADRVKKWQLRFNIEKCMTMHHRGIREGRASNSMERPDGQRMNDSRK